jgi:hypothetical protein
VPKADSTQPFALSLVGQQRLLPLSDTIIFPERKFDSLFPFPPGQGPVCWASSFPTEVRVKYALGHAVSHTVCYVKLEVWFPWCPSEPWSYAGAGYW